MMISGGRTKQLDIFCHITGFTGDFMSVLSWSPSFVYMYSLNINKYIYIFTKYVFTKRGLKCASSDGKLLFSWTGGVGDEPGCPSFSTLIFRDFSMTKKENP